jgi:hypothetical protein
MNRRAITIPNPELFSFEESLSFLERNLDVACLVLLVKTDKPVFSELKLREEF